jgi:hypothetical protein
MALMASSTYRAPAKDWGFFHFWKGSPEWLLALFCIDLTKHATTIQDFQSSSPYIKQKNFREFLLSNWLRVENRHSPL